MDHDDRGWDDLAYICENLLNYLELEVSKSSNIHNVGVKKQLVLQMRGVEVLLGPMIVVNKHRSSY